MKQNDSIVTEYTKLFEDSMADVQEENPEIGELWFIRCFVNALRDGIKIPNYTFEISDTD